MGHEDVACLNSKPLVCYGGEPDGIPSFTGSPDECDATTFDEAMRRLIVMRDELCECSKPSPDLLDKCLYLNEQPDAEERAQDVVRRYTRRTSFDWEGDLPGRSITAWCNSLEMGVVGAYDGLHMEQRSHPLFDLVTHVGADQMEDFRSTEAFSVMSDELADGLCTRTPNFLVPGGGSFVTPLYLAMDLVDREKIDSADFVITEITDHEGETPQVDRVRLYLEHYAKEGLITDFEECRSDDFEQGFEVCFGFSYEGVPITVTMAIDRSESYCHDEHLQRADVFIFHSLGLDDAYQDLLSRIATLQETEPKQRTVFLETGAAKKYALLDDGMTPLGEFGNDIFVNHWDVPYGCLKHTVHYPVGWTPLWQEAIAEGADYLVQAERTTDQCPFKTRQTEENYHVDYQQGLTMLEFVP